MTDGIMDLNYPERRTEPRLADGSPLYHAFLEDAIHVDPSVAQAAQQRMRMLENLDPEAAARCNGLSVSEARNVLESIESRMH